MCKHIRFRSAAALAVAAVLPLVSAACEDTAAPQEEVFEEGEVTVDASSYGDITYFSLVDGVVTSADAATSTSWHLGFRRFNVRVNSGVSGPGSVTAVNLSNNAELTQEQIVALSEADGDSAFQAVTEDDVAGATFVQDDVVPAPGASWFRFDRRTNTVVANPRAAWKVRESSSRGHAVFRVSELTMQGQRPVAVGLVVEYRQQAASGALGDLGTIQVDLTQGPQYLDFANGRALGPGDVQGPGACAWDIGATPALAIEVNADCSAGTFPLDPNEDFTALTTASDAPKYGGFLSAISGAFPATLGDASGLFWYNIEGNSRLWPTYNVFLVRAGQEVYKVQITNYYSADGTSGFPTVKFLRLR